LKKIWVQELQQIFSPSDLPSGITVIGITLVPNNVTNVVGQSHTVTAKLTDLLGNPQVGIVVNFSIIGGPNSPNSSTNVSDANGNASFTYTGNGGIGIDQIQACFTKNGNLICSAVVTKEWIASTILPGEITAIRTVPNVPVYRQYYKINLSLYNPNSVAEQYNLGLKDDNGFTTCNLENPTPPNVKNDAYSTHVYSFRCNSKWNWINTTKVGWTGLLYTVALKIGGLFEPQMGAFGMYQSIHTWFFNEPTHPYYVNLSTDSTPGIVFDSSIARNIVVNVPQDKKSRLGMSVTGGLASSFLTMAVMVPPVMVTPLGAALLIGEGLGTVESWYEYQLAFDPDFNYTTVQEPVPMYLPELDALPAGNAKEFGLTYADVTSLKNATLIAYVRYDGARIDNQSDYMLMQLKAANNFTIQALQRMSEVERYYKLSTSSLEPLTDAQIQQGRKEIQTNGLPQIEINILTRNGLGDSIGNITQAILAVDPEIYRNPKNYTYYLDMYSRELSNESVNYESEIIRIKVEDNGNSITTASNGDIAYLENLKGQIQISLDQGKATPGVKTNINEMINKSSDVLEQTNNIIYEPYYEFAVNALAMFQTLDTTTSSTSKTGSISGMKFNDLNHNGIREANESRLANWTITLTNQTASVSTTLTDSNGNYSFTNLTDGNYTVGEVKQSGWTQTAPKTGTYNVTIIGGSIITGKDFGNFQTVNVKCDNKEEKDKDKKKFDDDNKKLHDDNKKLHDDTIKKVDAKTIASDKKKVDDDKKKLDNDRKKHDDDDNKCKTNIKA
jgi:hypothetical protein